MENYKSCIHSDYSIFSACNPDWHAPLTSLYANPAAKEKRKKKKKSSLRAWKMQQVESLLLFLLFQRKTRLVMVWNDESACPRFLERINKNSVQYKRTRVMMCHLLCILCVDFCSWGSSVWTWNRLFERSPAVRWPRGKPFSLLHVRRSGFIQRLQGVKGTGGRNILSLWITGFQKRADTTLQHWMFRLNPHEQICWCTVSSS